MTAGPATTKLYLTDPYTHTFTAQLVRCDTSEDGRIIAVLDTTYFYPESGGQVADRGSINEVAVLDVWEDGDEVVYHHIAKILQPGEVTCRVDGDRRFDHMQQHTGQHILSRAFITVNGLNTISFHMGDEACTIDLDGEATDETMSAAEQLANRIIWEDREVDVREVSADELDSDTLRKKLPEGVTQARLVEIRDFDVIGCCGTHVRRAGELGVIKVLKQERVKGASRVTFKVGARAYADFVLKHGIVRDLAGRFTTSVEDLERKIDKLVVASQTARKQLQKTSKRLAQLEAADMAAGAEMHGAVKFVVRFLKDSDDDFIRMLSAELKNSAGTVNLLANGSGSVVCNAAKDVAIDFTAAVVERAREAGGSGGGKGGFASVRLPSDVSAQAFLDEAFQRIKAEL